MHTPYTGVAACAPRAGACMCVCLGSPQWVSVSHTSWPVHEAPVTRDPRALFFSRDFPTERRPSQARGARQRPGRAPSHSARQFPDELAARAACSSARTGAASRGFSTKGGEERQDAVGGRGLWL